MSIFGRLFSRPRDREELRALWERVVAIARAPQWYQGGAVADSVSGRFDMISLVTALVALRLERTEAHRESALLIEWFVEDIEGQLRELGINDVVVGKRMGKLIGALNGRRDALGRALASSEPEALRQAVERNLTLEDPASSARIAQGVRSLWERLEATDGADLVKGNVAKENIA